MVLVLRRAFAAIVALALVGAAPAPAGTIGDPGLATDKEVPSPRSGRGDLGVRRIDLSPVPRNQLPGRPQIDWDRIKKNTQEYEQALARHKAALEPPAYGNWPKRLLDDAQRVAPVLGMWDRVIPPSATPDERKAFEMVGREVDLAKQFIDIGAKDARLRFDALEASLKSAKHKDVLLKRVAEQRALLETRVARANELSEAVHLRILERDGTLLGRVKEFWHNQTYTDAGSELVQLRALLAE